MRIIDLTQADDSAINELQVIAIDDPSQTLKITLKQLAEFTKTVLALGTASTHDVTISSTDETAERVLRVGDFGLGNRTLMAFDSELLRNDGLPTRFFNQGGGSDSAHFGKHGAGVHISYEVDETNGAMSVNLFVNGDGNLDVEWLKILPDGSIAEHKHQTLYGPLNKPTSADIGALKSASQSLEQTNINTIGNYGDDGVYYQPVISEALPERGYPIKSAGTLLVTKSAYGCQQEYTTFSTGQKFTRGLSGVWNGTGPWFPWKEFSQLTDMQLGAEVAWSRPGESYAFRCNPGCMMTGMDVTSSGGDEDNINVIYQKPIQKFINGIWYTISG